MKSLRKCLAAGETLIGSFVLIPHPAAVEMMGLAGFPFLLIDAEHCLVDRADTGHFLRAADSVDTPVVFRIPSASAEWIATVLDAGAAGVLVPRVESAEQARAMVQAMRYPPLGRRGVGPGRAARYGYEMGPYLTSANDDLLLAIQVETAEGLANIDAIAAVEGIDAIYIGPADLAMSLGAMGPEGQDRMAEATGRIVEACHRHQVVAGMFLNGIDAIPAAVARGMRFMTVGADMMFLKQSATGAVAAIEAANAAEDKAA